MPMFTYSARSASGRPQKGAQEAASAADLVRDLRQRGYLVLDVKPAQAANSVGDALSRLNPLAWLPPRSIDIELSLQQITVMLHSGLTLLSALRSAAEYASRRRLQRIWLEISELIQKGSSFADAIGQYPRFPHLLVHLIRVGEQTGSLDAVIGRSAEAMERQRILRTQVLTALTYPAIVFAAAIGVTVFMIVSVIPKLKLFLAAVGKKLPPITQALVDVSDAVATYGLWVAAGLALAIGTLIALYLWPPSRVQMDRWLLRVPLFGKVFRLGATVTFSHAMGVLLRSGITLVEALRSVQGLHRNHWVSSQIDEARSSVVQGGSLAASLAQSNVFMPMLPRMIAVGESTGTLDDIMDELARFHDSQLQATIRRLSVLIEPAIVVFVGGIVGFVYISFFVALFSVAGGGK